MPAIGEQLLSLLKCNYRDYTNFIETGSFLGETIMAMEPLFSNLHTIEIKKDLYDNLVAKNKSDKIQFHLGDSSAILEKILPTIKGKSIIFLDAHWSCGITGKGKKDVPLYEELTHIINYHDDAAIIIIDDLRLFGCGPTKSKVLVNWEDINIESVVDIVKGRMVDKYILPSDLNEKDRLIIHLRPT